MKRKGQIGSSITGTVMLVISVVLLLVVGAVMFGQLATVNTASLGNNSNATAMINAGFDLLTTARGIITLVVVIVLLALALGVFMGFGQKNRR